MYHATMVKQLNMELYFISIFLYRFIKVKVRSK